MIHLTIQQGSKGYGQSIVRSRVNVGQGWCTREGYPFFISILEMPPNTLEEFLKNTLTMKMF